MIAIVQEDEKTIKERAMFIENDIKIIILNIFAKKNNEKKQEIYKSLLLFIDFAIINNLFDLFIITLITCCQVIFVKTIISNSKKVAKLSLNISTLFLN